MVDWRGLVIVVGAACVSVMACDESSAFDLTGAWAAKSDQCKKVFTRTGRARQVDFTVARNAHGGGFIAEADRLRSRSATCSIKERKEDGQVINLVVACAKGVLPSTVQFFVKIVDDNTIIRVFPGVHDMNVEYHRCKI